MTYNWCQFFCYMMTGLLLLSSHIKGIEDIEEDEDGFTADKRFLLALPTPKRLSSPLNSFSRHRRPMGEFWDGVSSNNFYPEGKGMFTEDKRFLLGLPTKSEFKRFLLGLPSTHRNYKRFILGLPTPTRFNS
ncbi:unnamed protein product [Heterobilharzia americana]|nr:unnamed protein product [Heterobilharzia americana]